MGIGFAAIAVAAWHAILAIGSAIQRGAVWALVVALKASAHAGSRSACPGHWIRRLGAGSLARDPGVRTRDPAGRYLVRDRRACKGGRRRGRRSQGRLAGLPCGSGHRREQHAKGRAESAGRSPVAGSCASARRVPRIGAHACGDGAPADGCGTRGLAGSGERRASRGARSRYGSDLDRPGDRLARGCCCAGSRSRLPIWSWCHPTRPAQDRKCRRPRVSTAGPRWPSISCTCSRRRCSGSGARIRDSDAPCQRFSRRGRPVRC